jgi:signal transduction histidine kinase
MQNEMEERSCEIVCDQQLPVVAFDRRLMKLALKQLLDNALKYSPSGTAVEVRVRAEDNRLAIEVTDHGAGIPIHEQARIFERFYRSASVRQQIPGAGLGLSIAHRIVQAHNGDLKVISRPGETTFRMTLPTIQTGDRG